MARGNPVGNQILALVDEIETDARLAAKSMPAQELQGWIEVGSAPLMARAAWSDAVEMARQAEALGQRVDVERVFRKVMGPRAFEILMAAIGGRR